jgi:hypothetical protein
MPWHDVAAYFFGGAFLANFVPHFVSAACFGLASVGLAGKLGELQRGSPSRPDIRERSG